MPPLFPLWGVVFWEWLVRNGVGGIVFFQSIVAGFVYPVIPDPVSMRIDVFPDSDSHWKLLPSIRIICHVDVISEGRPMSIPRWSAPIEHLLNVLLHIRRS